MTTSSPGSGGDDARGDQASGADGIAQRGGEPPGTPRDPYAAPPAGAPPQEPGPYGHGPGGYGEPLASGGGWRPTPRNGFGIAALVLGIVSILLFPGPGIILGVLGIIFGILGIRLVSKGEATNTGMAITGIALSAIGLTLGALVVSFAVRYWPKIDDCVDEDKFPTSQQREDCVRDKLPDWATSNDS